MIGWKGGYYKEFNSLFYQKQFYKRVLFLSILERKICFMLDNHNNYYIYDELITKGSLVVKADSININNWRNQMAEIVITKENFQKEVLESDKTVLLDFFADWCGPCQMLSPIINEIAQENPQIKVGKINVDEQQELAMQYNVMSIPFLAVFKNGKLDRSTVGYMPKDVILKML